jgi:hypothetical protein
LVVSPAQRNLDQYVVMIEDGRVFVDPQQLIIGETVEPLCLELDECP